MGSSRAVFAAILTATGVALAEAGAADVVDRRIDGMKAMSAATKALGAMKLGLIAFSPEVTARAAGEIARHAEDARTLFPADSLTPSGEALPAIRDEPDRFDASLRRLVETAGRLAAAADEAGAMALAAEIGDQCVACHDRYRRK